MLTSNTEKAMQVKEDQRKIFRHWTWKKFLLDSLFMWIIYLLVGFLVELPDILDKTLTFSAGKMALRATFNAMFLSFFTTLWSPDKESIFEKIIKKRSKKNIG